MAVVGLNDQWGSSQSPFSEFIKKKMGQAKAHRSRTKVYASHGYQIPMLILSLGDVELISFYFRG